MGNMVGQFTFMLIYAGRCYAGDGVGDIWSVASLHLRVPPNGAGRMATVNQSPGSVTKWKELDKHFL